jgi:hypothetical protein
MKKLSRNAKSLLRHLASPGQIYCYVARASSGGFVFVPSKDFNWDGRVSTPRILHPEALTELVDHGFLRRGEYEISLPGMTHGGYNLIYEVTEEGKNYWATFNNVIEVTPEEPSVIVHILFHGYPLCRFSTAPPRDWPENHKLVRFDDPEGANCQLCIENAEKIGTHTY